MRDLTKEVPILRMSVAKGRLTGLPLDAAIDIGTLEAAAKLAVKRAAEWIPDLHPFHLGHIDVLAHGEDGHLDVTVTVQGHARADLDGHAMTGVVAALLSARTLAGADAAIEDVRLVQNVY